MISTSPRNSLDVPIAGYLFRQRALGRGYQHEERVLMSLSDFLAAASADDLDLRLFEQWCDLHTRLSGNTRRSRQRIVRNFCLYRRRTAASCFVPDPSRFPRPHPHQPPVIFGPDAVSRMLEAAKQMAPNRGSPLRPAVMRMAVTLLYTAGLRRGELLRLSLADVNANDGVLHIRESKFHKSRWVPLSADATRELRAYLRLRLIPSLDPSPSSALLCNCTRGTHGYTGTGLSGGIHELFDAAEVRGWDGRRPRVHDFRHSFAIECLLRWYRQGVDVQSNLPKLAMYMGHVSIASTAYYLRWVQELAQAASNRFERGFGHLICAGGAL
jgi:integrase/recombinase XerD